MINDQSEDLKECAFENNPSNGKPETSLGEVFGFFDISKKCHTALATFAMFLMYCSCSSEKPENGICEQDSIEIVFKTDHFVASKYEAETKTMTFWDSITLKNGPCMKGYDIERDMKVFFFVLFPSLVYHYSYFICVVLFVKKPRKNTHSSKILHGINVGNKRNIWKA